MASTKPLVLICSTPVYGHLMPIKAISKQLVARGYEVTFLTSNGHRPSVEGHGAEIALLEGECDFTETSVLSKPWAAKRGELPPGPIQFSYDMEYIFVNPITSQYESQQKALRTLEKKHPGRNIVVITECFFLGSLPGMAGAPGIRPAGYLNLGITPVTLSSIDCAAFGPGLPPNTTPEGQAQNIAMNEATREQILQAPQKRFIEVLKDLGATAFDTKRLFLDQPYLLADRFLQLCTPSVEYPRSDAPASLRFAGGLPKGGRDPYTNHPSWWSEVTSKTKKVIAVSQGSVALKYTDLTIPTIQGLANRDDILLVVALGKKEATLPDDVVIPANTRVADWIPFDDLLPYCAAFITNGGYGAFQHGISNGTPLIVAGATEDKPEVAMRAEWCGIGINMRTGTPTAEAIGEAVDKILDPKYKTRALELQKEMGSFDPIGEIAKSIDELGAGKKA